MDPSGKTESAVKMYLLPRRAPRKKTTFIKDTLNPQWNQGFEFRGVTLEDLKNNRVLEFTVWDYDRRGCNDFIGCLRLGPDPHSSKHKKEWMDSTSEESKQWQDALDQIGEWVEVEHSLRPSIKSLTAISPVTQMGNGCIRGISSQHESFLERTPSSESQDSAMHTPALSREQTASSIAESVATDDDMDGSDEVLQSVPAEYLPRVGGL